MWKFKHPYDKSEFYFRSLRWICSSKIRLTSENYYEVLKLKRDCSAKEIRDAFIKLSKQLHPDTNINDPLNHQRFVKLHEAYSILSRPQKRSAYDLTLRNEQKIVRKRTAHQTPYNSNPASQHRTTYTDPHEYYNFWKPGQNESRDENKHHKKLTKSWIVFLCVMFASAGVGLQILAIRQSLTFSREKLDKMSEENSRVLAGVRQRARENSFEKQLEIMKQKIEDSVEYNERKKNK